MKSKKLILGLALAITMGVGVTAYASNTETNASPTTAIHQKVGLAKITGMKGSDYAKAVLKNKLGISDEEITAGFNAGKTMYDLAKEKEMSENEFKEALLEERNKAIDKAIADETITKEEGDSMKETLKNNMDTCTGIQGQGMCQSGTSHGYGAGKNASGKGTSKGHMSASGKGSANCSFNDTSN